MAVRLCVGRAVFVALGVLLIQASAIVLGAASLVWGSLAMSAGGFDVCYFSLILGGPFTGAACRAEVTRDTQPG